MSTPIRAPRWLAALTGVAAGAVTLAVAAVLAALLQLVGVAGGTPSPVLAVGSAFIDATPAWLKDWAIATFGTHDKTALVIGMVLVLVALCAAVGVLGSPRAIGGLDRSTTALLVFAAIGCLGLLVVMLRPGAVALDAVPTLLGTLVGLLTLARLGRAARQPDGHSGLARRRLLTGTLAAVGGGAVVALLASRGSGVEQVEQERAELDVPDVDPVQVPPGAQVDVPAMTPYVTPNEDFYRIDTAIVPPALDASEWQLRVHGMVENEVTLGIDELLAQPMISSLSTLTCVSNTVGGNLVGNAVWIGWPIRELLARAVPHADADMVLSTSSDGFTASTPIEALTDDREAILAVAMNGEPLPIEHGYPVRMVVPGLYGYVSATKWVVDLKVTTFAEDVAYWTPRGWSERGPIKTSSRIDVPAASAEVAGGTVVVAGVAWAQHRGIAKVEVQVDTAGTWHEAELAEEPTVDSWRQWVWHWEDAPAGKHTLTVRATDADGQVQVSEPASPAPDGATGLHTIYVYVQS